MHKGFASGGLKCKIQRWFFDWTLVIISAFVLRFPARTQSPETLAVILKNRPQLNLKYNEKLDKKQTNAFSRNRNIYDYRLCLFWNWCFRIRRYGWSVSYSRNNSYFIHHNNRPHLRLEIWSKKSKQNPNLHFGNFYFTFYY